MIKNNYEFASAAAGLQILEDQFVEMLDDAFGFLTIGAFEFEASRVLKDCDPIGFRCGFNDWADGFDWASEIEIRFDAGDLFDAVSLLLASSDFGVDWDEIFAAFASDDAAVRLAEIAGGF
jgi:hypothetical protein